MLAQLTTRLWKLVDHSPFLSIALVATIVGVMMVQGCSWEGTATDPFTGEVATAIAIKNSTEDELGRLSDTRDTLILQMQQIQVALGAVADDEDEALRRGNDAIEAANLETEKRGALVDGLVNLAGGQIPGFGWLIAGGASMAITGGLGLDRARVGGVAKRRGRRIEELENGKTE